MLALLVSISITSANALAEVQRQLRAVEPPAAAPPAEALNEIVPRPQSNAEFDYDFPRDGNADYAGPDALRQPFPGGNYSPGVLPGSTAMSGSGGSASVDKEMLIKRQAWRAQMDQAAMLLNTSRMELKQAEKVYKSAAGYSDSMEQAYAYARQNYSQAAALYQDQSGSIASMQAEAQQRYAATLEAKRQLEAARQTFNATDAAYTAISLKLDAEKDKLNALIQAMQATNASLASATLEVNKAAAMAKTAGEQLDAARMKMQDAEANMQAIRDAEPTASSQYSAARMSVASAATALLIACFATASQF